MPFPAEKNFTDGELAVEQAIARGATPLVLVGSFRVPAQIMRCRICCRPSHWPNAVLMSC
jgi:hypothetical protein